ncbi:uncharacterized protein C1orf109 homolog [Brienomyrus brachyistius]|uniref:uncharacterized protein C1orf109 homolog n=1 Tax=Brienomyrus brachyistius TaxID=42636 RepID=UPI0020B40D57|nr:uncharacterized protein C1orf109 homolog [Brienomyrus brachyistius]
MSKSELLSLHQALKRSFQVLEQNQKLWNGVLAECSPLMVSLGNLAEQLHALQNVQLERTPLKSFPDLRERLRFKLLQAVDTVMEKLYEKMAALQAVRDAVSNQAAAVFQLYTQHADALDMATCLQRSATCPSVADMLEWLQDAERHYQWELLKRKALLQMLKPGDLAYLQTSPKRWESLSSRGRDDIITETLCRVALFNESQ